MNSPFPSFYRNTISNGNLDDEDMSDISDWEDIDYQGGISSQVTFDGKSCMKLDTSEPESNILRWSKREKNIGNYSSITVFSFNIYLHNIGVWSSECLRFYTANNVNTLRIDFASDGLYIRNFLIDASIIVQDTWQEWTFIVDWTEKTVDVYLDKVLKYSNINFQGLTGGVNGLIDFQQFAWLKTQKITYIDWLKVGNGMI